MMNFAGKRILVTGGTRGIGRAAVELFLESGAKVAVNGRGEQSTQQAIESLAFPGSVIAAPGDLSTVAGCERVVSQAVAQLGGLDVLVNNAGIGSAHKPIEKTTESDWNEVLNLNLRAVYFCIKYAVPALRAANGNVVNVASILGLGGRGIGGSLYCISKGGVVNMTRDLAIELAPAIRVNCVCPGAVDTEMLQELGKNLGGGDVATGYDIITRSRPFKRVARPTEIAAAIAFCASDHASFMTGAIQVVDGGVMAKAG